MKYIKTYEKRNFRDYKQYNEFLAEKFVASKCSIHSEFSKICISLKYMYVINSDVLADLQENFKGSSCKIFSGRNSITYEIYNVPRSFFDQIDMEMTANKYNL